MTCQGPSFSTASQYKDSAFDWQPLGQRVNRGTDYLFENEAKQKNLAREAAADTEQKPPELRLGALSLRWQVDIEFTHKMSFPETTDFV